MHTVGVIIASILSLFNFSQLATATGAFFDGATAHQATILFGGDMMFDRTIRATMDTRGGDFLFFCIDPMLADSDLTVANLEGPITNSTSVSNGSAVGSSNNFVFTFPRSTAALLARHHIELVNLGNNHILNFNYGGVRSTIDALSAAGVWYFGDPISDTVALRTIHGIRLAFINYNEFAPGGSRAMASTTMSEIREAKVAGYLLIVYTHWGIEYEPLAPQYVRDLAHQFVDAGAVAVIGSHPHVVEDHETYKGVPIYYSLGNFIFDQYWDASVTHGLLLKLTFNKQGVTNVEEIPVRLNRDRTVCPMKQ